MDQMTYWLDEVTGLAVSLTTSDDGSTLLNTALDVVHDSVVLGLRDLGTLVGGLVEGVTVVQHGPVVWHGSGLPDSELGGGSLELLGELIVNTLLDVDPGSGTACLTVVEAVLSALFHGLQVM
jgi:hypothetical protein